VGRSEELMSRADERPLRRGRVRCARASTGRIVRTRGEGRGGFQLSGMTLGFRLGILGPDGSRRLLHQAGMESSCRGGLRQG